MYQFLFRQKIHMIFIQSGKKSEVRNVLQFLAIHNLYMTSLQSIKKNGGKIYCTSKVISKNNNDFITHLI